MEVRQASSWVVNSATRVAMAREKARALKRPSAFFLQQVALQARPTAFPPEEEEVSWKPCLPPKGEGQRRRTTHRAIAVSSFAMRMIQRERAGGSRRLADPRARALEEAAMRWEARQTK